MKYITHTIEPWMPAGALKAKSDMASIAAKSGWQLLPIERYNDVRFTEDVRQERIQNFLNDVDRDDIVLHQFPTYMSGDFEEEFQQAVQQRKAKYVLFIHDFEPLRVERKQDWEWQLAQQADLIIAHSPAMIELFQKHGIHTAMQTIDLFDYLGQNPSTLPDFSTVVNYAGTWQKAPWLQTYTGPELNLFGSRPKRWKEVSLPQSISWVGSFDPEAITTAFSKGFGLLWDSDYNDKFFQSYTKINAPHKASLYLKAGLPLIVWSQSYLADLVTSNQIGFTINSLEDLATKVALVSPTNYRTYQKNAKVYQTRVSNGYYTKKMLDKVVKFFN